MPVYWPCPGDKGFLTVHVPILSYQQHPSFMGSAEHSYGISQTASVIFFFRFTVVIAHPAKIDFHIVITLSQSAFLLYLDGRNVIYLPVYVHTVVHFFRCVINAVEIPYHSVLGKYFSVHNNIADTELGEPQTLVIPGAYAEFKTVRIAVLVIRIVKTSQLDYFFFYHLCHFLS